jgi:MATE family multidrug resistance protein
MSALPLGEVRPRHVVSLAWPVLVSMLSMTCMSLADAVVAGWHSTSSLAAVGLAATFGMFLLTPARGLIRGLKITTSQATGAGDSERVQAALTQGLWLALGLGALLACWAPFAPRLFAAMGTSAAVSGPASGFLAIMMLAAPVSCAVWTVEGWLQAQGDTRSPMRATLVANLINIALDPVLVLGWGAPEMGAPGAALATAIAMLVQLGLLLAQVPRPWGRFVGPPDLRLLRRAVLAGAPVATQWTLDFAGFVVLLSLLSRSGDEQLAAHVLVFRLVMLSMLPGLAVADAAGVLVGQAVGAGRPEAARQAWWVAVRVAGVLMGSFGVAFLVIPGWFVMPFDPDPAVAAVAVRLLGLAALWQLADAVLVVNLHALMAAGDTRFTMLLTVGGSWCVQVPLSTFFVAHQGGGAFEGWAALTAEILMITWISAWRVRGTAWLEDRPVAAVA